MTCNFPLRAWKARGGGITFTATKGWSDLPLQIPCGKCRGCKTDRAREWGIRCVHEAASHDANSFLTLTYNAKHLPFDLSIDVRHWQLFAKKLRQKIGPFRFFHSGEYGDQNLRPHYHACIFGHDFIEDRRYLKTVKGNAYYTSKTLDDIWGNGHCVIGELTYESAQYVARYVFKKLSKPHDDQSAELYAATYERIDYDTGEVFYVKPEYTTMSRRPGIGKKWLEQFKADVYPADEVILNGRRYRPPRFYDQQLAEDELKLVKSRRTASIIKRGKNLTPERLVIREKVQELQQQNRQL